jgi:hypothetical protein
MKASKEKKEKKLAAAAKKAAVLAAAAAAGGGGGQLAGSPSAFTSADVDAAVQIVLLWFRRMFKVFGLDEILLCIFFLRVCKPLSL